MPKYKEQRFNKNGNPIRKSEFDESRECYMDGDGNYIYNTWVKQPNGKYRLEPVCIAKIGEEGVTAEYTILLDDMDCEDDRKNEAIRKNRDVSCETAVADYENDCLNDDGDKKIHPFLNNYISLCQQNGYSLSTLPPKLGISRSAYSKWKNGTDPPAPSSCGI